MIEVISFSYDELVARSHREGLALTGKSFWVGSSIKEYLDDVGQPFERPNLMFVDLGVLQNLGSLIGRHEDLRCLAEVPAVVISSFDSSARVNQFGLKVIGTFAVYDQYEPEAWVRMVKAYDLAQAESPNRPVDQKAFDRALKTQPAV